MPTTDVTYCRAWLVRATETHSFLSSPCPSLDGPLLVLRAPPRGGTQPGLWGSTSKASGLGVALGILLVPVMTPPSAG